MIHANLSDCLDWAKLRRNVKRTFYEWWQTRNEPDSLSYHQGRKVWFAFTYKLLRYNGWLLTFSERLCVKKAQRDTRVMLRKILSSFGIFRYFLVFWKKPDNSTKNVLRGSILVWCSTVFILSLFIILRHFSINIFIKELLRCSNRSTYNSCRVKVTTKCRAFHISWSLSYEKSAFVTTFTVYLWVYSFSPLESTLKESTL